MLPKHGPESKRFEDWLHNLMNCVTVSLCFWSCSIFSSNSSIAGVVMSHSYIYIFLLSSLNWARRFFFKLNPLLFLEEHSCFAIVPTDVRQYCIDDLSLQFNRSRENRPANLSLYLYLTYCFFTPKQLAKFKELLCLSSLKANARKPWLNKPMNYLFVEESSKTVSLIKACIICPWFNKILRLF